MTNPFIIPNKKKDINVDKVDEVADKAGFGSREPLSVRSRRKGAISEGTRQIAVNLPVSVYERLRGYCEERGITYRTAIERSIDLLEEKEKQGK
jgi:macrodomain Ter protein organizer (MatP/YcbG family)